MDDDLYKSVKFQFNNNYYKHNYIKSLSLKAGKSCEDRNKQYILITNIFFDIFLSLRPHCQTNNFISFYRNYYSVLKSGPTSFT